MFGSAGVFNNPSDRSFSPLHGSISSFCFMSKAIEFNVKSLRIKSCSMFSVLSIFGFLESLSYVSLLNCVMCAVYSSIKASIVPYFIPIFVVLKPFSLRSFSDSSGDALVVKSKSVVSMSKIKSLTAPPTRNSLNSFS